jgi:hypothetical protein
MCNIIALDFLLNGGLVSHTEPFHHDLNAKGRTPRRHNRPVVLQEATSTRLPPAPVGQQAPSAHAATRLMGALRVARG